jgi:predicted DNA-binding transcriptional regulator AlpA
MTTPLDFQVESLEDREHIHIEDFVTLMAHAEIPIRTGATGIDCIAGATAPTMVGGPPAWFSPVFTEVIRTDFERVLPTLPHLQYPMSEDAEAAFIRAYLLLPNRPYFIPLLLQDSDLQQDVERRRAYVSDLRRALETDNDFHLFSNRHAPLGNSSQDAYLDTGLAERILRKRGLLKKFNEALLRHRQEIQRIDDTEAPVALRAENRFPGIPVALLQSGKIDSYVELLLNQSRSHKAKTAVNDHLAPTLTPEMHANNLKEQLPGNGTIVANDSSGTSGAAITRLPPNVDDQNLLAKQPDAPLAERVSKGRSSSKSVKSGAMLLSAEEVGVLLGISRSTVYNRLNPKMTTSYDPDFPAPREYPSGKKWIRSEVETYVMGMNQNLQKSQPGR